MGIGFAKTKMNLLPDTYCLDVCVFLFLSLFLLQTHTQRERGREVRKGGGKERESWRGYRAQLFLFLK